MKKRSPRFLNKLWHVLAAAIILAALLVSVAGLLTPFLNEHRHDIENIASNLLKSPVTIQDMKITWYGYEPELSLRNVTVQDTETKKTKVTIRQLDLDFSLWRSLFSRSIIIENVIISGVDLAIAETSSGTLQLGNLATVNLENFLDNASTPNEFIDWISNQRGIILQDFKLHIFYGNKQHFVTLKKLSLNNKSNFHVVEGQAVLNQELPTKIDIHFDWTGDLKKIKEANGNSYLYFQNLSLPQWFSKQNLGGFKIIEGLANIKLWMNWNNNEIYHLQSEFNVSNLEFYSALKKEPEVIHYLSARLGWKHAGDKQTFVGDNIILNLNNSTWPQSQFVITATGSDISNLTFNRVQFNYVNLTDISRILLNSTLLTDNQRYALLTAKLQGVMRDVDITVVPTLPKQVEEVTLSKLRTYAKENITHSNLTNPETFFDFANLTVMGKLVNVSISPVQTLPGLTNLSGIIHWNGRTGNIAINSKKLGIDLNKLFVKPLFFDNAISNIDFSRSPEGNWIFNAPSLHLDNKDITTDVRFLFSMPNIGSPYIDLGASFTLMNAAHVSHYLPLKKFDPDLDEWLQNAFLKGRAEKGIAEIKGNLTDFPFDTNPNAGKFFVTAHVKDVDFHYAPDWPRIENIEGQLSFLGSKMTVDIATGKILSIPVFNVHGEIPYIGGSSPQVLNVTAELKADASKGMDFIQQSPLRNTIGKELAALKLTGPMQLNLGLEIPLKNPSWTHVSGAVLLSDSQLALTDWNLQFNKVNGRFNFTEESIEGKGMTGEIFGEPAILDMTTLHEQNKPGQVKAEITSKISVNALQNWLKVDFKNIFSGAANYQLQLFLSAANKTAEQDRFVFLSNLKGMALNLPAPFGKTLDEERSLQISVGSNDRSINAEINYATIANAALTFRKDRQSYKFLSGELQIGNKKANFQTAPGVLISGSLPEIDVTAWRNYFSSFDNKEITSDLSWDLFRGINLNTDLLKVMGTALHQVNVQAERGDYSWHMKIDSHELSGAFMLPYKWGQLPITGYFQKIHIPTSDIKVVGHLDPRSIPSLELEADNITLGDLKFGHTILNISPTSRGLNIDKLIVEQSTLKLSATGDWTQINNKDFTRLTGQINAPRIGDVLSEWGYGSSNLIGSTGDVKFDLHWADVPYQPSLSNLNGKVNVKLGKGNIINLSESTNSKIGLGRLLNIFSLTNFSFDFSNGSQEGYQFDSMVSDFNFKNGNAFIENMRFEGPIAGVIVKGRVGLIARDLNVQLGVMPHVTGSLPVVAAIAGGPVVGPVVGIATFLVDRVVTHQEEKSSRYDYLVTGSWDNPVWKKLDAYGRAVPMHQ